MWLWSLFANILSSTFVWIFVKDIGLRIYPFTLSLSGLGYVCYICFEKAVRKFLSFTMKQSKEHWKYLDLGGWEKSPHGSSGPGASFGLWLLKSFLYFFYENRSIEISSLMETILEICVSLGNYSFQLAFQSYLQRGFKFSKSLLFNGYLHLSLWKFYLCPFLVDKFISTFSISMFFQ